MMKKPQHTNFDRVMTLDEAALVMRRSKKTLWRLWAKEKAFPKPILIKGRAIGWRESTINKFLDTGEIER
ncbi:helix-turn-helix transcriptional regulator [Vibrio caribbeanicus]|uniref:helix-turn-helix transcriptional regulator n=1 Tax=Vibrio caribbeanicus TaxID=701175 RepID=UPI002283EA2C|nr:AlpA family phage regulatory protein [Vibrio caribbeanicus]MCY9843800.1 AlpA family phage regulatory protein [Vibrio caribbeanicus]